MENITLGQIAVGLAFLVGLISSICFLHKKLKDWFVTSLKEQLAPIREDIKGLDAKIDVVDMEACKNFLVRFLSDVEQGNEIDEVERMRFFEEFEHYQKKGGNSYIHDKVTKLQKAGKL